MFESVYGTRASRASPDCFYFHRPARRSPGHRGSATQGTRYALHGENTDCLRAQIISDVNCCPDAFPFFSGYELSDD